MQIVIGSTNPVKFSASRRVLGALYPDAVFQKLDVPSGVSDQPWGDRETQQGAYNRARAALKASSANLAVGLEGGVLETPYGLFTSAWCVLLNDEGRIGIGGNACTQLPDEVIAYLKQGMELGHAMDALSGLQNTKHQDGAIGLLTNGLLTRQSAYENIIKMALSPFVRPEWYAITDTFHNEISEHNTE